MLTSLFLGGIIASLRLAKKYFYCLNNGRTQL